MPIGVIRRFYERVQDDDHVGIFGDIKAAVRRAAVNDQLDHASANGINKLLDSQSWFLVKLNPSQIFAEFILHISGRSLYSRSAAALTNANLFKNDPIGCPGFA
jgi:hypothetical protein